VTRYPKAGLIALDYSLPMLGESKPRSFLERLSGRGRRAALCADFERIPLASRSISMLWSNMALHWASDVQTALAEFHRVLEIGGLLMFSTLGPDTLKELRAALSGIGSTPRVHGFIDMHDLGDMLVAAGFDAPVMDAETITLTYSNVESMIADLRATGQTCALKARSRGLLSPRRWRAARSALETSMREGRLPATIEVVYGHAWKPEPRVTAEGHAIVAVPKPSRLRK
jgi:malonyl-CoA O-methyltransferase